MVELIYMSESQDLSLRKRLFSKWREITFAAFTFLLGVVVPMIGINPVWIPIIMAGAALFTSFAIFTGDTATEIFKRILKSKACRIIAIFFLCILATVLTYFGFNFMIKQSQVGKSQIQIDTTQLINDINIFVGSNPNPPVRNAHETDEEYMQKYYEYYDEVNTKFFIEFNSRVAKVGNKLQAMHIITDKELEDLNKYLNYRTNGYLLYQPILEKLNLYNSRLDELEKAFKGNK
jgi:hypothetical protein